MVSVLVKGSQIGWVIVWAKGSVTVLEFEFEFELEFELEFGLVFG